MCSYRNALMCQECFDVRLQECFDVCKSPAAGLRRMSLTPSISSSTDMPLHPNSASGHTSLVRTHNHINATYNSIYVPGCSV